MKPKRTQEQLYADLMQHFRCLIAFDESNPNALPKERVEALAKPYRQGWKYSLIDSGS